MRIGKLTSILTTLLLAGAAWGAEQRPDSVPPATTDSGNPNTVPPPPATAPAEVAAPTPPPAPPPPPPAAPAKPGLKITPYGFANLGAYWSSAGVSSADYPNFATTDDPRFIMSARQSRIGMRIDLPEEGGITGADLKGVFEVDFGGGAPSPTAGTVTGTGPAVSLNGNSLAWYNPNVRLRLAYGSATWKSLGNLTILAGQDYGPAAPLFAVSVTHQAGPRFWMAGNLFIRSPLIKVMGEIGGDFAVTYAVAMMSPMDTDNSPVDFGPGNRSRMPNLEGRISARYKSGTKTIFDLGVSGHYGWERFAVAGVNEVSSQLGAVDLQINLPIVSLRGEAFMGANLDALQGNFGVGVMRRTVGTSVDVRSIRSRGGWAQIIISPVDQLQLLFGGSIEQLNPTDVGYFSVPGTSPGAVAGTRVQNGQLSGGVIVSLAKRWKASVEVTRTVTHVLSPATQNSGSLEALQTALGVQYDL